MLQEKEAATNIAVKDISRARTFYEGILGFQPVSTEGDNVITYKTGNTPMHVYKSDYAGTNKATTLTWHVGNDIDTVARELKSKGVSFEHYEMGDMKHDGDIHVSGNRKMAWFKDPDGNILALANG